MPAPGDKLGRYTLEGVIDRGGQGEVWRARDEGGAQWALKLIFEADEAMHEALVERERWEREVLVGASVRHPCLPAVVDWGEAPKRRWLVSEFIDGETLARRYRDHVVQDAREFAGVMVCVCSALDALHHAELHDGSGVVHRDVKPSNVLITGYGLDAFAWLVDLGTAKVLDGSSTAVLGTLEYLAPEQIAGSDPSPQSDVWAAAAVALWLLTGHTPFPMESGETPSEYLRRRLLVREAPTLENVPTWADSLAPTLRAVLTDEPAFSPPTALEFAKACAAVGWPDGAPLIHAPLLTGSSAHNAETLALASAGDTALAPTLVLPRRGLVELADRVTRRRRTGLPWRAIAIIRAWAQGADAAEPAWHEAAATGDRIAAVRTAAEIERIEGWDAAQPLWQQEHEHGSPEAAFRLARHALDIEDRPAALSYLREARRRGHTEAAYRLAVLRRDENREDDEARAALEDAVAGGYPQALLLAGDDAYDAGQIARAEALWERAASLDVEKAAVKLTRLHLRRGDPELALAAVDGWAGIDCLLEGGRAAEALGDDEEARRLFEAARKQGSGQACGALGNQPFARGDWAAAETLFREAVDRGYKGSILGFGATLLKQGKRFDAELVLQAAKPSVTRALLLAAVHVSRGDIATAAEQLSAGVDDIVNVHSWAQDAASDEIRALSPVNPVAAVLWAEILRRDGSPGLEPERDRCLDAYRAAAALGDRRAAEWAAYYEPDPKRKRELLTRLLDDDHRGWRHSELAALRSGDGDAAAAITLLRAAAQRGWLHSMSNRTLLEACDEEEKEHWLRQADSQGSGQGARLLGDFLRTRLGAGHPDVEGAYSRADLRGDAFGAVKLGLVLHAKHGNTSAVLRAYERAARRGFSTGAFNAGTIYETRRQHDLARARYERAIELGNDDGYAALAWLEWTLGNLQRAVQLAEEADARQPSKSTAWMLGRVRLANGNRFGAIEAYERADALGDANAALDLADLWDDPADISVALNRAHQRITDPTGDEWVRFSPGTRVQALARIAQIRERRLSSYDGSSVSRRHVDRNDP